MEWSPEALEYFDRVPVFVRKAARRSVEAHARDAGVTTIDLQFVKQARERAMGSGTVDAERENRGTMDKATSALTRDHERAFFANVSDDPLGSAFPVKSAVHPGMGGEPVPAAAGIEHWENAVTAERPGKTCAYIHVPFCRNHCLYCGFYMNAASRADSRRYTDALISEISRDAPRLSADPIHAVYFGGGTPTVLDPADLERLLVAVREHLPLANDCEITVESSVEGISEERVNACLAGGANRFSVGVQTFDTAIRRSMGRRSDRRQTIGSLDRLRRGGRAVVAIDLVYGFPGQSMATWEDDLRTFQDLELDGVDLYQLNIFRGGPLDRAAAAGKIPPPATLQQQSRMYARGVELMEGAGYRRLSLTHWARDNRERSIYNRLAIAGTSCLQFGCGAGGTLGGRALFNEGDLPQYLERVERGEKPLGTVLRHSPHKPLFNALADGLDRGCLPLADIGRQTGLALEEIYEPLVSQWQTAGLLQRQDGRILLTRAGEFWQVNLAQALIDYFTLLHEEESHEKDTDCL